MTPIHPLGSRPGRSHGRHVVLLAGLFLASLASVSGHPVRGVIHPTLATAHVASPSVGSDLPITIRWAGRETDLRVVCFFAANTSEARDDDADWPRITSVGFELPGSPAGFSLLQPLDGEWELVEGVSTDIPNHGTVTLDFAIVARVNHAGWSRRGPLAPLGIPPGQEGERRDGTLFCVSGPFPDVLPNPVPQGAALPTTIERLINGVVVGFHHVEPHGLSTDVGVWTDGSRSIPLYPD